MTIVARVISWVSEVGEPFSFIGGKGEPITLHPVYAKVAETEVCQIFKTSADAALEVRGILIENMDQDVFLDVEDTGKVSKKGNKKWKLLGLQPPGEGEFIDLRKVGTSGAAGSGQPSAVAPDTSSDGVGDGEAPAPSGTTYSDHPVPASFQNIE